MATATHADPRSALMAELGETDDPRALIPGDPGAVTGAADQLRRHAGTMDDVATGLAGIRIPDWSGPASNVFWDGFTPEAGNWRLGRDAMNTAAGALDEYGSSLTWAQGQAAEAIALWRQGEQVTRQAVADGSFVQPSGLHYGPQPVGPRTVDPGEGLRQQAIQLLQRAREQLAQAGDAHASAIEKVAGKADGAPGWLTGPADFVDKKGPQKVSKELKSSKSMLEKARAGDKLTRYGKHGQLLPERKGPDVTVVGGTVEASVFDASARGATQLGAVTAAGQVEAKMLGAEASATAGVGPTGVNAQARANAYLSQVSADGSMHYGIAEVGGSGKAYVGAEAGAYGAVGLDGVRVGADAFIGGKAEAEVHSDVGGVGAGVTGEAWAGAGAEANATLGKGEDGKWHIGAEAGVGLGVGGKLGIDVTVDPGEVKDTLGDAATKLNPFD
jgi:hypothetical protein